MKHFSSIEKLDTGILYTLELASSLSVLLLAFGLIASMANVLTKGSVLTANLLMQHVWAWTQCIAVEASVAGTIMRTFHYTVEKELVKAWLYGFLSALLLFTAAIVSNIESVQQTLNIALGQTYLHVFVPVEALIWIRSIAIVLLIVAHALSHVQREEKKAAVSPPAPVPSSPLLLLTPEVVEALRTLLAQVTVTEEPHPPQALPAPSGEQGTNAIQDTQENREKEREINNYECVKAYLSLHPAVTAREVAQALQVSTSTANKWISRVRSESPDGK